MWLNYGQILGTIGADAINAHRTIVAPLATAVVSPSLVDDLIIVAVAPAPAPTPAVVASVVSMSIAIRSIADVDREYRPKLVNAHPDSRGGGNREMFDQLCLEREEEHKKIRRRESDDGKLCDSLQQTQQESEPNVEVVDGDLDDRLNLEPMEGSPLSPTLAKEAAGATVLPGMHERQHEMRQRVTQDQKRAPLYAAAPVGVARDDLSFAPSNMIAYVLSGKGWTTSPSSSIDLCSWIGTATIDGVVTSLSVGVPVINNQNTELWVVQPFSTRTQSARIFSAYCVNAGGVLTKPRVSVLLLSLVVRVLPGDVLSKAQGALKRMEADGASSGKKFRVPASATSAPKSTSPKSATTVRRSTRTPVTPTAIANPLRNSFKFPHLLKLIFCLI